MCKVKIWVYEGCLASAVSGPLDIFTTANSIWSAQNRNETGPLFTCRIESMDGAPVRTPSGMILSVDGKIEDGGNDDVLLLPGIYLGHGVPHFLRSLEQFKPLHPILRNFHQRGTILTSNCSASFMLADAGLLSGGHATTSWLLARAFRMRYPDIELRLNDVLTEHDRVICSGAATAFLNLALHLVERFAGPEIAAACAKILLIDANRTSQMPYITLTQQDSLAHGDPLVTRAQDWMRQRKQEPFSLQALAEHLAVSERTVIRRFHHVLGTTPTGYAQLMKIDVAKRLLETSTLTLETISERIGYGDLSSFRRLFKREAGVSPAEYRQQFGRHQKSRLKVPS